MMEKLVAQGLQAGLAPGMTGTALPQAVPAGGDVERFQMALNMSPGGPVVAQPTWAATSPSSGLPVPGGASSLAPTPITETASAAARAAQAGRRSVGEAILDSFRTVANNASSEWGQARQAIMSPSMTATEMLQTQMKLINVSFQIDLIGKGVTKVTSNLEQTLKTQ